MKRYRLSVFDGVLLLLVAAAALMAYGHVHNTKTVLPDTPEALYAGLNKMEERYGDQKEALPAENYMVDYTVHIENVDRQLLAQRVKPGNGVENAYNQSAMGTVKSISFSEEAGTVSADITISIYAVFTETTVTAPSGTKLKIGAELSLEGTDASYYGTGTIVWMSH